MVDQEVLRIPSLGNTIPISNVAAEPVNLGGALLVPVNELRILLLKLTAIADSPLFVMLLPAIGGFFAGMQGEEGIDSSALSLLRETFHQMNQDFSVATDGEIVDFFQGLVQNWRTFEEKARTHQPESAPVHDTVSLADIDEHSIPTKQGDTRLLPFTYAGQDDQIYLARASTSESNVESDSPSPQETGLDRGNNGEREINTGSSIDQAMDSGQREESQSLDTGLETQVQSGTPDEQSSSQMDVPEVGARGVDARFVPDGSATSETGNETNLESLPESDSDSSGNTSE